MRGLSRGMGHILFLSVSLLIFYYLLCDHTKEIKQVNPNGNQSWKFTERTDAKAEALVLWPSDVKTRLIRKDSDAGKDWRQETGMTEHEIVRWHHWLNRHVFVQAPGDGERQWSLACCRPWDCRVRHNLVIEKQHGYMKIVFALSEVWGLLLAWVGVL